MVKCLSHPRPVRSAVLTAGVWLHKHALNTKSSHTRAGKRKCHNDNHCLIIIYLISRERCSRSGATMTKHSKKKNRAHRRSGSICYLIKALFSSDSLQVGRHLYSLFCAMVICPSKMHRFSCTRRQLFKKNPVSAKCPLTPKWPETMWINT